MHSNWRIFTKCNDGGASLIQQLPSIKKSSFMISSVWSLRSMFLQGVLPSHASAPGRVSLQDKSGTTAKDTAIRGIMCSFGEVGTAKNHLPTKWQFNSKGFSWPILLYFICVQPSSISTWLMAVQPTWICTPSEAEKAQKNSMQCHCGHVGHIALGFQMASPC